MKKYDYVDYILNTLFALIFSTLLVSVPVATCIITSLPQDVNASEKEVTFDVEKYEEETYESNVYEYWRSTLNKNQQDFYDELKNGFSNFENKIYTKQKNISKDEVFQVDWALRKDHPEMYWIETINITYSSISQKIDKSAPIELRYRFLKEEIRKYNRYIEEKTNMIVERANEFQTDFEKIKYVHDELILMTEYEYDDDYRKPYYQSIVSLFIEGKAVCAGYSYAFKYIMDNLDIDAIYASGKDYTGGSHAWNKVKLDGSWLNLDITWDDKGEKNISYKYFLVEDEIFNKTHFMY